MQGNAVETSASYRQQQGPHPQIHIFALAVYGLQLKPVSHGGCLKIVHYCNNAVTGFLAALQAVVAARQHAQDTSLKSAQSRRLEMRCTPSRVSIMSG